MEGRYRACNGNHEWRSDRIIDNKHAATCRRCYGKALFTETEWRNIEDLHEEQDPILSRIKKLEYRVAELELILKRREIN